MAELVLRAEAKRDLFRIYEYGVAQFGEVQATAYYNQLFSCLEQIATNPEFFTRVDEIRRGYRRSICGKENVYFRETPQGVEVVRILRWQNIKNEL